MPFLNINNADLYYEDQGAGKEAILFGHSMLFNLRMFDDQVAHLKSDFRCLRFDFRGQGKSEVTETGYDLDSLTEDTASLINTLGCHPCHFVGFSMGGMVALRLAVKYPELIKSLILIDTSSEVQDGMPRNKMMLWIAKNFGIRILANKVMSMFFGQKFLKDPDRLAQKETWKNHFLSNHPKGIIRVIKGVIFRAGISHTLNQINKPTIILVGENDILTDINKATIIKKGIAGSELELLPRAGHMAPVEEPELVNQIISKHLKHITLSSETDKKNGK